MMQLLKLLAESWVPGDTWCSACACDYTVCVAYMISLPSLFCTLRMSLGFAFTIVLCMRYLKAYDLEGLSKFCTEPAKALGSALGETENTTKPPFVNGHFLRAS